MSSEIGGFVGKYAVTGTKSQQGSRRGSERLDHLLSKGLEQEALIAVLYCVILLRINPQVNRTIRTAYR